jgi:hypothetical protein
MNDIWEVWYSLFRTFGACLERAVRAANAVTGEVRTLTEEQDQEICVRFRAKIAEIGPIVKEGSCSCSNGKDEPDEEQEQEEQPKSRWN